ncbi:MAG: M1 family metallopeptidase [Bacteroidota bacterium]
MRYSISLLFFLALSVVSQAQYGYWQQRVDYVMDIDFNVKKHQYDGLQTLTYTNNSPDTLHQVFYHLYFNAFQPGSMMDVRSRNLEDSDARVSDRISKLSEKEQGYIKVSGLTQDGTPLAPVMEGTILEVELAKPILPGQSTILKMEWEAQVPIQIRRSGRNSAEGISYSMSQWYPKLAEYDYQGWHANPYIAREFHGVWGDFDVTIHIDSDYILGGTGYLQNPEEIGYGYAPEPGRRPKKLSWHFKAPNVHDFMWGADPDYTHTTLERPNGTVLHFFYQEEEDYKENWEALPAIMNRAFDYIEENYGPYPYDQYTFIQGGDGGMEYPMGTLITGRRNLQSLVGVSVHELMHTWYQMLLATDEARYAWMDEGFTSWASTEVGNWLRGQGVMPGQERENPHNYAGFRGFRTTGLQEPLSTHADHFSTNAAYGVGSYTKGSIWLEQLRYIVGEETFKSIMLRYYREWRFKHPTVNDFVRVAEKESGFELDWYKEYWVNTTHAPDYQVVGVSVANRDKTLVELKQNGKMPMPVEILIEFNNGNQQWYYTAPRMMRGTKPQPKYAENWTVLPDWPWTHPEYSFEIEAPYNEIKRVTVNPRNRMYDDDLTNNSLTP